MGEGELPYADGLILWIAIMPSANLKEAVTEEWFQRLELVQATGLNIRIF